MTKYGKLTEKEIKSNFDAMVEDAKKKVDKGEEVSGFAFAIGNEATEMLRGNIKHFDYINLEARKHIKEIIEYAAKKKAN